MKRMLLQVCLAVLHVLRACQLSWHLLTAARSTHATHTPHTHRLPSAPHLCRAPRAASSWRAC
jgi:hypothetical protein